MPARKLTKREALDLVIGAKILACGGGGSEAKAIKNITQTYDNQNYFTISDLDDFNLDDHICIIGMVGGGITEEDHMLVEGLKIVDENPMITAVKELEEFLDIEFQGFVATELGPNNSIIPLMVAAQTNKIAIDGDCCGRSKPKISISTTRVAGISISPLSMVNHFGDVQIVKNATNDIRGEIFAREAARISGGSVSVARCPMTIEQAHIAVIPKTFSLAIKLGRYVRIANENKTDPIESIKKILPDAKFIFSGKVKDFSRIEEGGFTSGEIILETSEKSKKQLRIWYQNEYLLSCLNNEHYVTCPDGFYVIDSVTGHGLTPWEDDFKEGREVTIFTRDAPQIWQSKKGLSVFGPKVFNKNWTTYKKASSFS
ncbi:MAG: DUF917 domain-containing protein [Candidatus Heimdallarchaeota archaeon]